MFYFIRAKRLYATGGEHSVILERVVTTVLKAVSFATEDVQHYVFLAKVFVKALDLPSALFCLRYALKLDPKDTNTKKKIGDLLFMIGQELLCGALLAQNNGQQLDVLQISKARAYFDECLKYDMTNKAYWIFKSLCHIHLATAVPGKMVATELHQSQEAINHACRLDRAQDAEVLILRSKLLWAAGLHEQGNADLRVAEKIDPEHPEVTIFHDRVRHEAEKLYHRSVNLLIDKDHKRALEKALHALSLSPMDVKIHVLVAKAHRLMHNLKEAYAAVQKSIKMMQAMHAETVAAAAFALGRKQHALAVAAAASQPMTMPYEITQQYHLVLNDMAMDYVAKGDYPRALALFNKIIESNVRPVVAADGTVGGTHWAGGEDEHRFLVNRGDCYRVLNRVMDAIRYVCVSGWVGVGWEGGCGWVGVGAVV